MSESEHSIKKPVSIIQEIENQLEDYLRRQREEIEKSLEERIQKERELARQQLSEIEQAVRRQWQALEEYGHVWEQFEGRRQEILQKINDCLERITGKQKEIEELARATAEDLKALHQWQEELEELRRESMERAAFLKKGLEEKFGLKAEMPQPAEAERVSIDLTPELEKLRKVKELLLLESGQSAPPAVEPEEQAAEIPAKPESPPPVGVTSEVETPAPEERPAPEETAARPEPAVTQTETRPLSLKDKLAEEIRKTITERLEARQPKTEENQEIPGSALESLERVSRQDLEEFYRQEQANGYSPIRFYQKGKKNILEAEELLTRIREAVEEAKKLNYKLAFVTAAKEQFYLKQEIISLQEGLRQYLLRVIFLTKKKNFRFPALTQDLLNQQTLEELSDLLAVENWSSVDDILLFEQKIIDLAAAFKARTTPASIYYGALKKELEA
ncbi:MAG: hypothetical protein NUW07_02965 [Candidatus Saccharicenans sp.]|jgi:hypothetical protein|nr:hypothetical protein [Candidatus Saccharicenans sp.]MDH7492996.1 hypothetical protein [Candidatus Saccharicenans sp.]